MPTLAPQPNQTPPRVLPRTPLLTILGRLALLAAFAALIIWSYAGLQFDFKHFPGGVKSGAEYVARMFPQNRADLQHDRAAWPDLVKPTFETIQIAVFGTTLGALIAFPLSFIAARTGYFPRPLSSAFKTVLNVLRSVPTYIYALVTVSAIGLGASAGAMTIAFVSAISLAKLYAESLETVAVGPIEAVRASGGNAAQVFVFGMLPQVFPLYLSTTLYTLEYNFKDAFIVGIVGAGGLGYALNNSLRLYQFLDAGIVILLMVILVNAIDYLSYRLRLVFA